MGVEWQPVAYAFASVVFAGGGLILQRIMADLRKVADKMGDIALIVHGHGIRLDMIEGREHER